MGGGSTINLLMALIATVSCFGRVSHTSLLSNITDLLRNNEKRLKSHRV